MNRNQQQSTNKTKREVISEILALLVFGLLTFAFKAYTNEFNSKLFLEQAESLHLKDSKVLEQYKGITDIRTEINTYVKHEPVFDKYLDEICENLVGNTMLKMLIANVKVRKSETMRLCDDYDPEEDGSFYDSLEHVVSVKLCYYDENGIGIPDRGYYGVDKDGSIKPKGKSLANSIFHELTHALHHYEQTRDTTQSEYLWSNQEEKRTISGYIAEKTFDPICENCFDVYNSMMKHVEFLPRIGHCGFRKTPSVDEYEVISTLYQKQKFDIYWYKVYMIA